MTTLQNFSTRVILEEYVRAEKLLSLYDVSKQMAIRSNVAICLV